MAQDRLRLIKIIGNVLGLVRPDRKLIYMNFRCIYNIHISRLNGYICNYLFIFRLSMEQLKSSATCIGHTFNIIMRLFWRK